jgi:hypothetical protein
MFNIEHVRPLASNLQIGAVYRLNNKPQPKKAGVTVIRKLLTTLANWQDF